MTKNLNKELKKYYRDISKALSGIKEKKAIIAQIKNSVAQYLQDNPEATLADITQKFGSPEEIVEQYFDEDVAKNLSAQLNKRRKVGIVVAILVLITFIIFALIIWRQSTTSVIQESKSDVIVDEDIHVVEE